jgi:hypothetical protein
LALGAVAAGAGCTFLIDFQDQPACDGGACADAAADGGDGAVLLPDVADGPYAPCEGLGNGAYCGTDHLKAYRGSANDLVQCADGGLAKAIFCDGGCLSMPDPFPDTCGGCLGKANGTYCGRDFPDFPHGAGGDDDFLIGCQSDNTVVNSPCPHGCKSSGADASCY